jgi:short subunit dehydrogenase-like uncharacterized protein
LSSPHDILTWLTVNELRDKTSLKTKEVILVIKDVRMEFSGGSFDSIMTAAKEDRKVIKEAKQPWVLSPIQGIPTSTSTGFFGTRNDPDLGMLAVNSLIGPQNRALVHRTWGLLDGGKYYGPHFQYNEYDQVSSTFAGILSVFTSAILGRLASLSFVLALLKSYYPPPGSGPDLDTSRRTLTEIMAVAIADTEGGTKGAPRAYASFSLLGGAYIVTAAFLAQGAASLLYNRKLEGGYEGGLLTPACLGADLVERIRDSGAKIEVKML